jgi:hypothetical protein
VLECGDGVVTPRLFGVWSARVAKCRGDVQLCGAVSGGGLSMSIRIHLVFERSPQALHTGVSTAPEIPNSDSTISAACRDQILLTRVESYLFETAVVT